MKPGGSWSLWLRWVAANAVGELLGLGSTFLVFGFFLTRMRESQSIGDVLVTFFIAIGSGAIEASIVSAGQWWAMRPWFPAIRFRSWWLATLIGALIAYAVGYLPSTLMSAESAGSQATVSEPSQWIVLLFAAGLGAVAGAVLSFAQWLVLRQNVSRAGFWIPANMLAWTIGMPLIFWGIDTAQKGLGYFQSLAFMAFMLLITGAVVGAIHGGVLVHFSGFRLCPLKRAR